jgi:hypothetical protein
MADKPRKSAQQKAQEELDKAERLVKSLTTRRDRSKSTLATLEGDLKEAVAVRDHIASHPALTQPTEDPQAPAPVNPADEGSSQSSLPDF